MKKLKARHIATAVALVLIVAVMIVAAVKTDANTITATPWGLLPPLIAIVLALITKEVYSSLLIGILSGALLYSGFQFEGTMTHVISDGVIAVLTDSWNVGILIFLVILGCMVSLMNKAGGSAAFGRWASTHIKTKVGAKLAVMFLGVLIFIDDYFNCLTVGSVMLPVTDKHKISRAKLAYLIDATAAPVCIIAPISSWAAAVSGFVDGANGIDLFVRAIPFNFYALLTLFMIVIMIVMNVDYGPMAKHEANAEKGDLFTTAARPYGEGTAELKESKGKVLDLVLPVVCLIVCCVIGMIYTGGFFAGTIYTPEECAGASGLFSGVSFVDAFSASDASIGLVLGSFFALVITFVFYMVRRVMSFSDFMASLPEGFKAMVPAILILTFAWSLKAMTDSLGAAEYVAGVVKQSADGLQMMLPSIIFLIACGLSFATGTSWGTFGILIPIVVDVFVQTDYQMMIIAISACMAGAVCGDHCSPISDTTIMASAGARCDHVNHVSTQLPYAITVAAVSFVCYLVTGLLKPVVGNFAVLAIIGLILGMIILTGFLAVVKFVPQRAAKK